MQKEKNGKYTTVALLHKGEVRVKKRCFNVRLTDISKSEMRYLKKI